MSEWLHGSEADDERPAGGPGATAIDEIATSERDQVIASVTELGPVAVGDLRAKTSLGQVRLGIVLQRLQAEGLVCVDGAPGHEVVDRLG